MSMMDNLKSGLSDMKSRTLLFVMLLAVCFLGIIVFFAYHKVTQSSNRPIASRSDIANPGANIQSIPGVSQSGSKQYNELQAQKTKDQAAKAYASGGSDVSPILSPGSSSKSLTELQQSENQAGDSTASRVSNLLNSDSSSSSQEDSYKKLEEKLKAQQEAQAKELAKQRKAQQEALERQQQALRQQQYKQDLAQQIQALKRAGFAPNSQPAAQTVVYAEKPKPKKKKTKEKVNPDNQPPKIIYKAGTMLQGVLLSSVNSDTPAPIVAQVVNGPLRGARLVGNIDEKSIPKTSLAVKVSKALILNFTTISIPQLPYSIRVKAIAINPDTAGSTIATDVDNHYLLRYGTFLGATFLSGLSQAIQQSGQQVVAIPNTNNGNNQNQLAVQQPKTSKKQQIEIAVGNAMQQLVSQVNYLGVPPTIKIASGTAIGLLLLDDLTEQRPSDTTVQKVSSTATITSSNPRSRGASNMNSGSNTSNNNNSNNATNTANRLLNNTFEQQINRLNSIIGSNN